MDSLRNFWQSLAEQIFSDVATTSGLDLAWAVNERGRRMRSSWLELRDHESSADTHDPQELTVVAEVRLELPRAAWGLPDWGDKGAALVLLADIVQEEVIQATHAVWPKCPVHEHSLVAASVDKTHAFWRCPELDRVSVPIGSLDTLYS